MRARYSSRRASPAAGQRMASAWSVMYDEAAARTALPVSTYFLKRQLTLHGVSFDRVRADRVLSEALATGADPVHLSTLFDLSETTP